MIVSGWILKFLIFLNHFRNVINFYWFRSFIHATILLVLKRCGRRKATEHSVVTFEIHVINISGVGIMMKTQQSLLGILCAFLGGILWGFSGTCGQYIFANSQISPSTVTIFRMIGAGIILCALNAVRHKSSMLGIFRHKKDVVRLILFAIVGLATVQFAYLKAIDLTNAGTATMIQYAGLIWIMLITCLILKRLPYWNEAISVLLVLSGIFFLATHGDPSNLALSPKGLLWCISSSVAMMLYTMIPGPLLSRWGSDVILGYALLIGGIFIFIITGGWNIRIHAKFSVLLALAAIIILGTAVAFSLYMRGIALAGPVKTSLIASVDPVAASVISAVWLKTAFTAMDLVGFVLIFVGVILVTIQPKVKS